MGELAAYNSKNRVYNAKRRPSRYSPRNEESYETGSPGSRRQLLRAARSAIGTPYVVGGMSPGGFDCSGLVCWAYGNVGVKLPRTAREQSVVGTRIRRVEDMRAGDIVAFRHPKRGYHTGIYLGDGKFIHSPRRKSHVRINSLDDPYFSETFLSARRINLSGRENLLAQAENRLKEDYAFSPVRFQTRDEGSRSSRNASREKSRSKRFSIAEFRSKKHSSRHEDLKNNRHHDRRSREVAHNSRSSRLNKDKESSRRERGRELAMNTKTRGNRDLDRKRNSLSSRHSDKNSKSAKSGKNSRKQEAALNKNSEKRPRSDKKKASSKKS
ncbi:MAG: C40 family peptidase [Desulfovibrio sp.]|nr:C40 family peptidase [Desulfovibrio sp.]